MAGARLAVGLAGGRSVVRELRSGLPVGLRQLRPQRPREAFVRVAVVQTGAMLVGGDDVRLDVTVDPGAALLLQDISATLAHPMPGGATARQRLLFDVGAGGRLAVAEEPLVVARGAVLTRDLRVQLHGDARCLLRETLVLGRHGEPGGRLHARVRVTRDGVPLLDDGLDTGDPAVVASPAVLGGARVAATLAVFGVDVPGHAVPDDAFVLDGGDLLVRRLGTSVRSQAPLDGSQRSWQTAALEAR